MQSINILGDFPQHNYNQWKLATEKLLVDKPFERLQTKTLAGITLNPIYFQKDLDEEISGNIYKTNPACLILREIEFETPQQFNTCAKQNLIAGQNAILVKIEPQSPLLENSQNWQTAFQQINLERIPLFIKTNVSALHIFEFIKELFKANSFSANNLTGGILFDPLTEKALTGEKKQYYQDLSNIIKSEADSFPKFSFLNLDGSSYHNSGANAVQELAFTMAGTVESVRQVKRLNPDLDSIGGCAGFNFAIGSNFFMEIVKLRAARILWKNISDAFKFKTTPVMQIHAETSLNNKTKEDEHTNILRATTEAFSAIIGGCNCLLLHPHDYLSSESNDFSERIAHNIQLILREEVHAENVLDPAAGSWYVESLTRTLTERAWKLFQEIENRGGYITCTSEGYFETSISNHKKS